MQLVCQVNKNLIFGTKLWHNGCHYNMNIDFHQRIFILHVHNIEIYCNVWSDIYYYIIMYKPFLKGHKMGQL